jgi:RNA polymerase sigma-70 factor (ECF subfamily)
MDYARYVIRLLRRFGVGTSDMDDAAQDVFERLHRRRREFEGRAKLETWIHAFCWRVAAEYRRRARRQSGSTDTELSAEEVAEVLSPQKLHASLNALDAAERDLFVLHEVGELSISALSELTGSARATIRRQLKRARALVELGIAHRRRAEASAKETQSLETRFGIDQSVLAELARDADTREYLCADYGFSRCDQHILGLWRATPNPKTLAICAKLTLALAAEATDGFTFCSVIEPSAGYPDAAGRAFNAWLMARVAPNLRAVAFVTLGSGLRTLVPQIANSVVLLSGQSLNIRFFREVEPAFAWLADYAPDTSLSTLMAQYERIRSQVHALDLDDRATRGVSSASRASTSRMAPS